VVDEDINIYSSFDVEWAIATRVQWDRDIFVVSSMRGLLDPSAKANTPPSIIDRGEILTSKIGIDATVPFRKPQWRDLYERVGF
jgi:UbiD family decarboxylase